MTYATEQAALSRTPCSLVVITLDFCSLVYGVDACTAPGGAGNECYNTFPTCQVPSAYAKTTKEYKFTGHEAPLPFSTGERPYIKSLTYLPTEIKDTLTIKGRCTVDMADEPDTDIGIDPYVANRSSVQGTFWKKLLARNPNYKGRRIAIYDGFVGVSEADFVLYGPRFVGKLDNITISRGSVKIEAVDLLKSLEDVEIPAKLSLKLAADITVDALAITLAGTDVSEMDSPTGYIRIDDEIIYYGAINTTTKIISSCTRDMFGTTAAVHSANAKVQLCKYYGPESPFRTMCRIMDDAGIAEADVDVCAFVTAHDFGEAMNVSAIITEPEKAATLYGELVDLMGCKSWVSEDQRVTIARTLPNHPDRTYAEITDDENILAASGSVDLNQESQVTRCSIYWDLDAVGKATEQTDYRRLNVVVHADAESASDYGAIAEKTIMTRWVKPGTLGEESSAAGACKPLSLLAVGGDEEITLTWDAVAYATSYNIYWDTSPGVTQETGTKIEGVTSPYVHTGRTNGQQCYYVATAVIGGGETPDSNEATAIPMEIPGDLWATGYDQTVYANWADAAGATSYNIYWDTSPDVTKETGTRIEGITAHYDYGVDTRYYHHHEGRTNTSKYYYIVTAVNGASESEASTEASAYATGWAATDMLPGFDWDGGFEDWTTPTNLTKWVEYSPVNREAVIVSEGTYSCNIGEYGEILSYGAALRLASISGTVRFFITHKATKITSFNCLVDNWGATLQNLALQNLTLVIPSSTDWTTTEVVYPARRIEDSRPWVGGDAQLSLTITTNSDESIYFDSIKMYCAASSTRNPYFTDDISPLNWWDVTEAGSSTVTSIGSDAGAGIWGAQGSSYFEEGSTGGIILLTIDASNNAAGIAQTIPDFAAAQPSTLHIHHQETDDDVTTAKFSIYSEIDSKYLQADDSWNAAEHWFILDHYYELDVLDGEALWGLANKEFTTSSAGSYTIAVRNNSAASAKIYLAAVYTETTRP